MQRNLEPGPLVDRLCGTGLRAAAGCGRGQSDTAICRAMSIENGRGHNVRRPDGHGGPHVHAS